MDLSRFTSSGRLPKAELARQQAFFQDTAPEFLAARYALSPGDARGLVFDGHGELINPCHAIACRACGSDAHRVTMHTRGILTHCAGCDHTEVLMGEAGSGAQRTCDCGTDRLSVVVRLEYPGDVFDMGVAGQEAEFFTWVTLFAHCPSCEGSEVLADAEAG